AALQLAVATLVSSQGRGQSGRAASKAAARQAFQSAARLRVLESRVPRELVASVTDARFAARIAGEAAWTISARRSLDLRDAVKMAALARNTAAWAPRPSAKAVAAAVAGLVSATVAGQAGQDEVVADAAGAQKIAYGATMRAVRLGDADGAMA